MGIRFRKKIKIAPGVSINISKSGLSASIGPRGMTTNIRAGREAKTTIGLPGTGVSSQVKTGSLVGPVLIIGAIVLFLAVVLG